MGKKKDKKKNKKKNKGVIAKASSALGGLVGGGNGGDRPAVLELAQLAASIVALLRAEHANDEVDDIEEDGAKVSKVDSNLRKRIEEIVDERIHAAFETKGFERAVRAILDEELDRLEALADEGEDEDEGADEDEESAA